MAKPRSLLGNGVNLPSSSKNRFHQAARDGYLDLLKGATRRDCDRPDEDGMTPSHWASYHGNVEALRLLVSRGGNPDKLDLLGNSCLHHAVVHGHLKCVSFLVTFGATIWAMDNGFRTPLDLAALHNHMDIVKYLDSVAAQQASKDPKSVSKAKQKAHERAVNNGKRFEKLRDETSKKLEKEHLKLSNAQIPSPDKYGTVSSLNLFSDSKIAKSLRSAKKPSTFSTGSKNAPKKFSDISGIQATVRRDKGNPQSSSESWFLGQGSAPESELSQSASASATPTSPPRRGLVRDFQVLYVDKSARQQAAISMDPEAMEDALNRATSENDLVLSGDSGIVEEDEEDIEPPISIFDRKGFGELAFFRHRPPHLQESVVKDALFSLPASVSTERDDDEASGIKNYGFITNDQPKHDSDSIEDDGLPWEVDALSDLDDDVNAVGTNSPLETFLASHGLQNFLNVLATEKIDLETLCLCSDEDLKEIGLPLGPRRKILDIVERRGEKLKFPETIMDLWL